MSIRRHFYIFRLLDHRCRLCFSCFGVIAGFDEPDTIFRTLSRKPAFLVIFNDPIKALLRCLSRTNRPTVRWKHHLSECNWEITEDPSFNDHYRLLQ